MVLTRSELEIMDVLWAANTPLSRSDLLERSQEKSWKDSSVHILLNGLLQKDAIREAYRLCEGVAFKNAYRRSDIGKKALSAGK